MNTPEFITSVSIIICTYNRSEDLQKTLSAFNFYNNPKVEIIVVDDGSTDNTKEIVKHFGVTYIKNKAKAGIARVRNLGFRESSGDYIVYIDDDCIITEHWLFNLLNTFKDANVMGVGGQVIAQDNNNIISRFMLESGYGNPPQVIRPENRVHPILYSLYQYMTKNLNPITDSKVKQHRVDELCGANCAFRREMLEKINGYDEQYKTSEDTEISKRLRENFPDNKLVYNSEAIVAHKHYTSLIVLLKIKFIRAKMTLQLCSKKEHKVPILFPVPLGLLILLICSFIPGGLYPLLTLFISPPILYFWWLIRLIIKRKRLDFLLFPYIQLCSEVSTMAGAIYAGICIRINNEAK